MDVREMPTFGNHLSNVRCFGVCACVKQTGDIFTCVENFCQPRPSSRCSEFPVASPTLIIEFYYTHGYVSSDGTSSNQFTANYNEDPFVFTS